MIQAASFVCTLFRLSLFTLDHHPSPFSAKLTSNPSLPDYENPSSYTHDLITSPSPSLDLYPFALAPYKQYSPCQLRLQDPHDDSETVTSVGIFISDKTNASTPGVTWDADDPAPKVAVDAGVAIAKSGSARTDHEGMVGGMWALIGAVAAVTVLL